MAASRALATRCPACGTVFRVVPDQLRVSNGWVRCGRCAEVFSAPDTLVDMDTGARQRLPEGERQSLVPVADSAADTPAAPSSSQSVNEPANEPAIAPASDPASGGPTQSDNTPHQPPGGLTGTAPRDADFGTGAPGTTGLDRNTSALPDPRAGPDDRPPPSFVRQADRVARWRQPRVRVALRGGALVAALALAAQVVFSYRDLAAANWPAARPALEQACTALGCEIGAAHVIDALAVQSSGLTRVDTSSLYRMAVTLRNQAGIDVAVPAIDLSLTDAQGRLLSRRVISLAELGHSPDRLTAGRELVLQATLQVGMPTGSDAVSGYTIELFYP